MAVKNVALSRKLAKRGVMRQCFDNALFACAHEPDWYYVEGWAVSKFRMPVQHGWCETPEGEIVDPTPLWCDDDKAVYFPAERYTADDALLEAHSKEGVPLFDVQMNDAWREQYLAATTEAYGADAARQLRELWDSNGGQSDESYLSQTEHRHRILSRSRGNDS